MSKLDKQFKEATDWLFNQFPSYQLIGSKAYKPTLDNISKITEEINFPQNELKFIHVAGSNGKGSTCSMLASCLTEAGYKVGLFTSPHIIDFTERIRVNGKCIPKADVVNFVVRIKQMDLSFSPSFFEISFAMALSHFKNENCDICIIETGLGGRLDATNIITPLISVITTISLEHTQILGNTLEEIAIEKSGIIKELKPVVIGRVNDSLKHLFKEIADKKNCKIIFAQDAPINIPENLGLHTYWRENYNTARMVINQLGSFGFDISEQHIGRGIKFLYQNTGFFGRLQVMNEKPLTIFDVSHNAEGIQKTMEYILGLAKGKIHVIYGTSADKDIELIKKILPSTPLYYFTEFSNPRSMNHEMLREHFATSGLHIIDYYKNANSAMSAASKNASANDLILVIGSFFLLGDFF